MSRISAAEDQTGAQGYAGLTLTFEGLLADNATVPNDFTHSVTFSGLTLADFGAESVEQLNVQILRDSNANFVVDSTVDAYGTHGYLSMA